jgi:integrase
VSAQAEKGYLARAGYLAEVAVKLTKRAIAALPAPDPSGKQKLHWDDDIKGFGILCSGTTRAKTYVVQRKLPGGLTRRVTVAAVNVLTLGAARARAKAVLAEFYSGHDPKAAARVRARQALTLRDALEAYFAGRKDLRPKSIKDYRSSVAAHLKDWMDRPVRDITPDMVEQRHTAIADEVKKRSGSGRRGGGPATGAASANAVMRALRAVYNFAAERDSELPPNPTKRMRRQWFPVPHRERIVRSDELPAFYRAVDALPSRTARDFLLLALFTGLRREEAAALQWNEVDFAQRLIRLPAGRTKAGRKLDLPMSSFVRDLLVALRALGNDGPFVFGANSRSGHIEEPRFPLAQIAEATDIAVTCHDLRRTYITIAESTDISPLALKALVNHALGGDVTSGYVQMTIERLRLPAQRVCDQLMELCGIAAPTGNFAQLL